MFRALLLLLALCATPLSAARAGGDLNEELNFIIRRVAMSGNHCISSDGIKACLVSELRDDIIISGASVPVDGVDTEISYTLFVQMTEAGNANVRIHINEPADAPVTHPDRQYWIALGQKYFPKTLESLCDGLRRPEI
ncbi:MAG TPA: hypothetical protein VN495_04530 [Candidatus Paceibacterota bacterium]|nr:hypothetical protein [Candidatus Paceibacterota bacterium]